MPEAIAEDGDIRGALTSRYKLATARMKVRQTPAKPAPRQRPPLEYARRVYIVMPGPFYGRAAIRPCMRFIYERAGYTHAEIIGHSREGELVRVRQEIYWNLSKRFGLSLTDIGKMIGGRDHSTVLIGIRKHQSRIDNPKIRT